ncbi:MAG: hypothetical protein ACI85O_001423 [Saprospiraceae bacterium]|jgi:hypothetical protein
MKKFLFLSILTFYICSCSDDEVFTHEAPISNPSGTQEYYFRGELNGVETEIIHDYTGINSGLGICAWTVFYHITNVQNSIFSISVEAPGAEETDKEALRNSFVDAPVGKTSCEFLEAYKISLRKIEDEPNSIYNDISIGNVSVLEIFDINDPAEDLNYSYFFDIKLRIDDVIVVLEPLEGMPSDTININGEFLAKVRGSF